MNLLTELQLLWRVKGVLDDTKEKITMPTDGKSLLTSKTFWANLLGAGIQIAGIASGALPDKYAVYTIAAQGILNILLRLVTDQPITSLK